MITPDLIKNIAHTARLQLSDQEIALFQTDFEKILAAFAVLDQADVTGVKSSIRPFERYNTMREDVSQPSLSPEKALQFTQNKEKGFFIGPRTIE